MVRWILSLALLSGLWGVAGAQEIRAFWADAFNEAIKSPEQVDTLIRRLKAANCNAIFAQVRKGGDAYYQSRYEPWASDNAQRFDALQCLIEKAHASTPRIQVHAWINTCAVGRTRGLAYHVAALHPDWLSLSDTGETYDNEATKIDPGHPDAADWTFRVYLDVARNYHVDGIHFDFVRYGTTGGKGNWGYSPVSVARFNARFGRSGQPDWNDPEWMQWRRDQVTQLVRKVYAMAYQVSPKVAVSAATITWGDGPHDAKGVSALRFWDEKSAPMNRIFQDWRSWMQEGILDLNCQMSYYAEAKYPSWFRHWADWGKDNQFGRWVVPSSGIWLNSIEDSFKQIEAIRSPTKKGSKPAGVLLYSYAGTNAGPDGKEQNYNEAFYTGLGQGPFKGAVEFPALPWKVAPSLGHLKGFVLAADSLMPVDGATVTVRGRVKRTIRTDGTGFYAFVDLPPGEFRVRFESRGYAPSDGRALVAKGSVATFDGRLGSSATPYYADSEEVAQLPGGAPVRSRGVVLAGNDRWGTSMVVRCGDGPNLALIREEAYPKQSESNMSLRSEGSALLPSYQPGDVIEFTGWKTSLAGSLTVRCAATRLVDIVGVPTRSRPTLLSALALHPSASGGLVVVEGVVRAVSAGQILIEDGSQALVLLNMRGPGVEDGFRDISAPSVGGKCRVTGYAVVLRGVAAPRVLIYPRSPEDVVAL